MTLILVLLHVWMRVIPVAVWSSKLRMMRPDVDVDDRSGITVK